MPSEFLRSLLREKKERQEAELRYAILEGYQDAIAGRVTRFSGKLRKDMQLFISSKSRN